MHKLGMLSNVGAYSGGRRYSSKAGRQSSKPLIMETGDVLGGLKLT